MQIIEKESNGEHEQVLFGEDAAAGYRGIIAIHSTVLGPAVGGTRFWNYASDEMALTDALRLSRGMTYKNALAGLPFGGGKSVVIGDAKDANLEELFRAHGRFVETLGGRYITAADVGTGQRELAFVQRETKHVAGLDECSGDPSPWTGHGVFRAMQASAKYVWGSDELSGRTVALQGCGHVGYHVAKELHQAGAKMVVTDVDAGRVQRIVGEFGAQAVSSGEIYEVEADIFAPCALGGILNDETIPLLKVQIIAGAANNQLLEARHGELLEERGILYAPDYVANAGGVIHGGYIELLGQSPAEVSQKVHAIYDTLLSVYDIAKTNKIPPSRAADQLAEQRLQSERKKNE